MDTIHFRPASADLDTYIEVTHRTFWLPVWPGDERVRREFEHWPREIREAVYIIYEGREPVGRVIMPQFNDFMTIRDLGLRRSRALLVRVCRALVDHAVGRRARDVRVVMYENWWQPFAEFGFVEQKRRMTMRCDLRGRPPAGAACAARYVSKSDIPQIGDLLNAAYRGTVDDEGDDRETWTYHARDVVRGQYGPFITAASFATPVEPPFACASLVVESAPKHALLGQVVTRRELTNRGLARSLINLSLDALTVLGYEDCFLEVTLGNENAVHLYQRMGFVNLGPQIVYGFKSLEAV
jgi:GNAT superfamily N-acetyltransferase